VTSSKLAQGNSVYHYGATEQVVDHVPFGAYPVEVVRELGGWAEDQYVNEDFEFDYRLRRSGRSLLFDPEVVIEWDCRQSVPALFRQYRRYGAGKVQTLFKHPTSAAVRHFAAPGLVAAVAAGCAMLLGRRTRLLGAAVLAPYGAVLAVGAASTVRELSSREEQVWVVPAFAALHMGWGVGFWEELVRQLVGRGGPRAELAAS
jgi:succinoglycan biosynthesis protein ExoA